MIETSFFDTLLILFRLSRRVTCNQHQSSCFFQYLCVEPICKLALKHFASVCLALASRIDPENCEMTSVDITCFSESSKDLISFVLKMSMLPRGRAVLRKSARAHKRHIPAGF